MYMYIFINWNYFKFLCDVKIIINYLLKIFYFVNNLKNL